MKRLHKRILTVCLALMMTVVMAVPAFAVEIQPHANLYTPYRIESYTTGDYLNVTGYTSGSSVILSTAIYWLPGRYNATTKLYVNSTVGNRPMVMRYNYGDVTLTDESTEDGVTAIEFVNDIAGVQLIKFANRNVFLTESNGAVRTAFQIDETNYLHSTQLWHFKL